MTGAKRTGFVRVALGLAALVLAAWPQESFALNCEQVRQLTGVYFKMHFHHNDFNDELSRRTLDNFLKAFDPGKVYFLEADVKKMRKKYGTKLDDMILDSNCDAIESVVKLYSKRFSERQKVINKLLKKDYDFSKEEYMTIDREKLEYAKNTEQINERWRKRIKFQFLQLRKTLPEKKKARKKLKKRYELMTKRHNEMTSDDVYTFFLSSFSSGLDPHSEYLSPEQLEDFRISTRLSLEGIGAVLRSEGGFTLIQSLVPGGAAAETGKLQVGDKIIAVAQGDESPVDVIDMDLRDVVKLIRGKRGTEVRLTIVREEEGKTVQMVVPIIREKIQLKDRAAKSFVYEVDLKNKKKGSDTYKIGVIELPSFYMDFEGRQKHKKDFKSSSKDVRNEISKLKKKGIDALVMDLRSNGGGSLDESINIAGMFFDKGPVVQIKDPRGSTYVQKDEDGDTAYEGPLLVMINRQSASASEIFAGAIQDYERGLIVGDDHTFGKGTVQNLNDIDKKLGAIKVTISKFYRASGGSTQLRGVSSDISFPSVTSEYDIGEKHYDYALPWEKIKEADHKDFGMVDPYLDKLAKASQKRVKNSDGFEEIRKSIKEYNNSEAERSRVSLKWEPENDGDDEGDKTAKEESGKKDEKTADADEKKEDGKKTADASKEGEDEEDPTVAADEKEDKKPGAPYAQQERKPLEEDPHLQETLKIASDYVRLLNKKPLSDDVSLPALDDVNVAEQRAEKKKSKVTDGP